MAYGNAALYDALYRHFLAAQHLPYNAAQQARFPEFCDDLDNILREQYEHGTTTAEQHAVPDGNLRCRIGLVLTVAQKLRERRAAHSIQPEEEALVMAAIHEAVPNFDDAYVAAEINAPAQ